MEWFRFWNGPIRLWRWMGEPYATTRWDKLALYLAILLLLFKA